MNTQTTTSQRVSRQREAPGQKMTHQSFQLLLNGLKPKGTLFFKTPTGVFSIGMVQNDRLINQPPINRIYAFWFADAFTLRHNVRGNQWSIRINQKGLTFYDHQFGKELAVSVPFNDMVHYVPHPNEIPVY